MRLTNHKSVKIIPGFYYFSVVFFFLIIFLHYQFDGTMFSSDKYYYGTLAGIVLLQFYVYFGGKYFEYDSEGAILSIVNKGVILSEYLNYRGNVIEIKREQLYKYKYYNFLIYKRMVIYAKGRNGVFKKHVNLTFVSNKKIRYVKHSLSKIIKENGY